MDMQKFTSAEVQISHAEFITMVKNSQISLGISTNDAMHISDNPALSPKKTNARAAMLFFKWLDILVLIFSLYASFKYHWWYFLIGVLFIGLTFNGSKKGNADNIIGSAIIDESFYEKIAEIGYWTYKMPVDIAEKYKR